MRNSTPYRLDRIARSTLIDALANDDAVVPLDQIVREHATELTIRRRQLTTVSRDGLINDSLWRKEIDFFIEQIVDPQIGRTKRSVQSAQRVKLMIDEATAYYAHSRVCFSKAYESNSLEDFDYVAIVSNAEFATNARQCAESTRVVLLQHDELTRLEERIFGTDSWRRIAPRLPPAATSDSGVPSMPRDAPPAEDTAQAI